MANTEQISMAVKVGASLSTPFGEWSSAIVPGHPNLIWDQLAAEKLYACIITDGIFRISFIKVEMKNKAKNTIVISDATCSAGMAPGEYQIILVVR